MAAPSKTLYLVNNRIRVIIRLTKKASRNTPTGLTQEADGNVVIKASVAAAPEDGKANTVVLKLLAKKWNLPKLSLKIVIGTTGWRKTGEINSNPYLVQPVLENWLKSVC